MNRFRDACLGFAVLLTTASLSFAQSADSVVGGKTIDEWIKQIASQDASLRELAIRAIPSFGPEVGKKAVPTLVWALNDKDVSTRVHAIIVLGALGVGDDDKSHSEMMRLLTWCLNDSQLIVRYQAAMTLGKMGPSAKGAVGALSTSIKDVASWEVRKAAAFALGRVGYEKEGSNIKAINALLGALKDYTVAVRLEAAQSLVMLGLPSKSMEYDRVKKEITSRLANERDKSVKIWLRMALFRLDKEAINDRSILEISKALKETEQIPRLQAAMALGLMGPEAKPAVPDLIDTLDSNDLQVVAAAMATLAAIGPSAAKALPALEKLKDHKDPIIKITAAEAITRINEKK